MSLTRRSTLFALASGFSLAEAARAQQASPPSTTPARERVFVNGKIFTARSEREFASAFRVSDGKISWVGDAADVRGGDAVDLQGRTVLPGFLDTHTHPSYIALIANAVPCTVPVVNTIPEMIEALKKHPNHGKGPNDWIEGWGYDESKLAEHRTPTADDLDKVSATQPVHVLRSDAHSGICNRRALEIAGITRDTPDPPNARFGRFPNGEPNGVLQEHAANDVVMRAKSNQDFGGRARSIAATRRHFNERGIVAVSDMMVMKQPLDDLAVFREAEKLGLRQQVPLYFDWASLKKNPIPDLTDADRNGRVKFAGLKLFADGSMSNRTAWVSEPYRDSNEHGFPTLTKEDLEAAHEWARRNRVQIAVHGMGDRALGMAIDFFADQEPWLGADRPSVRLEHVTLLTDAQMRQMKGAKMTFGVATQIIFFFAEQDSYSANLNDNQYRNAYRLKSYYGGVDRLALSSDTPATTWADPDNVFTSIKAAVTRRAYNGADIVREQALTVPQAVLLWTARGATVPLYEGRLGQIAPGFEASFIVLDRDIFSTPAEDVDKISVSETWIEGEKVYARQ